MKILATKYQGFLKIALYYNIGPCYSIALPIINWKLLAVIFHVLISKLLLPCSFLYFLLNGISF